MRLLAGLRVLRALSFAVHRMLMAGQAPVGVDVCRLQGCEALSVVGKGRD